MGDRQGTSPARPAGPKTQANPAARRMTVEHTDPPPAPRQPPSPGAKPDISLRYSALHDALRLLLLEGDTLLLDPQPHQGVIRVTGLSKYKQTDDGTLRIPGDDLNHLFPYAGNIALRVGWKGATGQHWFDQRIVLTSSDEPSKEEALAPPAAVREWYENAHALLDSLMSGALPASSAASAQLTDNAGGAECAAEAAVLRDVPVLPEGTIVVSAARQPWDKTRKIYGHDKLDPRLVMKVTGVSLAGYRRHIVLQVCTAARKTPAHPSEDVEEASKAARTVAHVSVADDADCDGQQVFIPNEQLAGTFGRRTWLVVVLTHKSGNGPTIILVSAPLIVAARAPTAKQLETTQAPAAAASSARKPKAKAKANKGPAAGGSKGEEALTMPAKRKRARSSSSDADGTVEPDSKRRATAAGPVLSPPPLLHAPSLLEEDSAAELEAEEFHEVEPAAIPASDAASYSPLLSSDDDGNSALLRDAIASLRSDSVDSDPSSDDSEWDSGYGFPSFLSQ